MANERNQKIKETKRLLKIYASQFDEKISYNRMYKDINQILTLPLEQREAALKEYYLDMATRHSINSAERRVYMLSSEPMANKNIENPALATNTRKTFFLAAEFVKSIANIIDPSFKPTNDYFGATHEEIRDRSLGVVSQFTYYNQTPKYLMKWDRESFESTIDRISQTVKEYQYKPGERATSNTKNLAVAEVYRKTLLVQDELSKHGRIWRFFHPFKTSMYNDFLRDARECLEKAGFNPELHHDDAIDLLKSRLCYPLDVDDDQVKDQYKNAIEEEKIKNTPEITVARDKLARGLELDKSPDTSLISKITPIYQKYGFEINTRSLNNTVAGVSADAQNYDKTRNTSLFKNFPNHVFYCVFKDMMTQAINKGVDVNVSEIIKDAHTISVIASHQYTPLYELDDAKDIIPSVGFGGYNEATIQERVAFFAGNKLPAEKIEQLKKDASDAMKKISEDSEKILREDRELISQEIGNEAQEPDKLSIIIELDEKNNLEIAPPSNESDSIEKDFVV